MAVSKKNEEKPKFELATKPVALKTLLKEATGTVVTLDRANLEKSFKALVKAKSARLKELTELELLDKSEFEELKTIRAEFRDRRYALQNVDKHNVSALNLAKKNNGAMIDELISFISPSEDKADEKIKLEEARLQGIKDEENRLEEERLEKIQNKINDAGTFFEAELEVARASKDWTAFDVYYKNFEDTLEELQELEFEGSELLEKYTARKQEIVSLVEQAEAQAEKDKELNAKELELQNEKDKMAEDKRRLIEMFGIGFTFNGMFFVKGEISFTEEEINNQKLEDFTEFVEEYKTEAENITKYNVFIAEAKELELDVTEFKDFQDNDKLEKLITEHKAEKTAEETKAEEAKKVAKAKLLKEEGKVVCDYFANKLETMTLDYRGWTGLSDEVMEYSKQILDNFKKELEYLKDATNQDKEEV